MFRLIVSILQFADSIGVFVSFVFITYVWTLVRFFIVLYYVMSRINKIFFRKDTSYDSWSETLGTQVKNTNVIKRIFLQAYREADGLMLPEFRLLRHQRKNTLPWGERSPDVWSTSRADGPIETDFFWRLDREKTSEVILQLVSRWKNSLSPLPVPWGVVTASHCSVGCGCVWAC